MAKRKGKSDRRITHWDALYREGDVAHDAADPRQRLTQRAVKLPTDRTGPGMANLEDLPKAEGMVAGLFPGGATVHAGSETLLCGIAKTFRAPEQSSALAVGDIVTVARTVSADAAGADKDRSDGMILSRQPRRTALSRPQPMSSKRRNPYADDVFEKVLVANMDQVVIVAATCQPKMRVGLIDRFLIIAERGQMKTLLAVNKIDISEPPEEAMEHVRSLGVEIFPVSAARGDGLDELRAALAGRRSVLAGASGVGKSTLVNALVPGANAATREVRSKDERGRHRTTSADVYELPGGGALVDTPGLRELSIRLDAAELTWYFPEFQALAGKCRFSDCTHTHEPDCAVQAAVETGEILPRRYESYLRILETLE